MSYTGKYKYNPQTDTVIKISDRADIKRKIDRRLLTMKPEDEASYAREHFQEDILGNWPEPAMRVAQ